MPKPSCNAVLSQLALVSDREVLRRINKPNVCLTSLTQKQIKQRLSVLAQFMLVSRSAYVASAIKHAIKQHILVLDLLEAVQHHQQTANYVEFRHAA